MKLARNTSQDVNDAIDMDHISRRHQPASSELSSNPKIKPKQNIALLRRYSLTICIIEAIIIVLFVAYLIYSNTSLSMTDQPTRSAILSANGSRVIFKNSGSKMVELFTGPINTSSCNQRKHDLAFAVQCSEAYCPSNNHDDRLNSGDFSQPLATIVTTSKLGLRLSVEHKALGQIECPAEELNENSKSTSSNVKLNQNRNCIFKTRLNVYVDQQEQEIIGWGGAMTDSSINNILSLDTNLTRRLLDDYFGIDGLMFNIVRITMGGSDFSSRWYTNDELDGPNDEDFNMEKFRLVEEDVLYKVPLLKFIKHEYSSNDHELGRDLKYFVSMWSPPTWMKTNRHINRGEIRGSMSASKNELNSERFFKALANYKKSFLLSYLENGIEFWGMTVVNEPYFAVQPFLTFNTVVLSKEDYERYVAKYLGPMIRNESRLEHIKLMAHDDNRRYLTSYTVPILDNNLTLQYIDGVSVHGYVDEEYQMMDEVYNKYKSKKGDFFVLPTELCSGHLPFMEKALIGNWQRGVHYGLDIIRSIQHSASGWVDWNMALDTKGGPAWLKGYLDSPIIVDKASNTFHKSPMYYVMGHFSRYVSPGSHKIKTEMFNDVYDYHFETVTFLLPNEKNLVTVIVNNNRYDIELNLRLVSKQNSTQDNGTVKMRQVICKKESVTTVIYANDLNS